MERACGDNWQEDWQPLVDAVGRDFGDGTVVWGADAVELGTVRRFAEPLELELGPALRPGGRAGHGFPDVIAPYTAAMSFSVPAMWRPGEPTLYDDPAPDAQPARSPINNQDMPLGPRTTGFFATDISIEFVRPAVVGERVGRRGKQPRLLRAQADLDGPRRLPDLGKRAGRRLRRRNRPGPDRHLRLQPPPLTRRHPLTCPHPHHP